MHQPSLPFGPQESDQLRALLLHTLHGHYGRENGIHARELAKAIGQNERNLRHLISALRFDGVAIVGTPKTGYYVAVNPAEIEEFCQFHLMRARHELGIVSRVKNVALPALLGQLFITA